MGRRQEIRKRDAGKKRERLLGLGVAQVVEGENESHGEDEPGSEMSSEGKLMMVGLVGIGGVVGR